MFEADKGTEGTEEVKPEVKPDEKNNIENWLDSEDAATELLANPEHPAVDEPEIKEAIQTEPEKEPPAEIPPEEPVTPIEEPEKPTQEEERSKPAVEEKQPPQKAWSELRAAQREKKALEEKLKAQEEEIAKLRAKPVEELPIEEYQPPATKSELDELRAKTAENDNQIAQIRQAEQTRIMIDAIQREETAFEKEHPDYREAVDYIKQVQLKEFELGGMLRQVASDLIRNRPEDVENIANQYGVDPEQCAKDLAFQILFETRKREFATRNVGKVAKSAYDLAQAYGFKPKANGKEEPVKEEPKGPTPQEKVQRAVKNQAVTQSLSAMTPAGGARNRQITSRQELMQMDPLELDVFVEEMDKKNPKWLEELE